MAGLVESYLKFRNDCREMGWAPSQESADYPAVIGLAFVSVDELDVYKDTDIQSLIDIHNTDLEIVPFVKALVTRYKTEFEKLGKQPATSMF